MDKPECPFANLANRMTGSSQQCAHHAHFVPEHYRINSAVPLKVVGGTHQISTGTERLLADIGGGDRIREFCTRFYARAFEDDHLKQFFFLDDGATAHGKRLADYIIEKMGGEGEPWMDSGRYGMRTPSHRAAWNSERRDESVRGRRFKLDDSRVWMRLHFWAIRECGLNKHLPFWNWYIKFIEHFIAVYERRAAAFTSVDAEWSANEVNISQYFANKNKMVDVIGRL